jgi:hypothetical protein
MFQLSWWCRIEPRDRVLIAYDLIPDANARLELRRIRDIVHIAFDPQSDTWTVEEDPEHRSYQNPGEAIDRARLIGKGPALPRVLAVPGSRQRAAELIQRFYEISRGYVRWLRIVK